MLRQDELVKKVKNYNPYADGEMLGKAYLFSSRAHEMQKRANGDPYFTHPVAVAGLLSEKNLDDSSIITGLLHDTLEDTTVTEKELTEEFSPEIADLVRGVTKLSNLETRSIKMQEAENFRKLVMAMSRDIRVLLVKLADRLHNMRTLHFINNANTRKRIAQETKDIYVPLAERIGLSDWKDELEDIAFKELNGEAHASIVKRLSNLRISYNGVEDTIRKFDALCKAKKIDAQIQGREKRPSSIWHKISRHDSSFEQMTDITAFRIIVPSKQDCYKVLGFVHEYYQIVPGRFKDYISLPKANGYQSLHSSLVDEEGKRIEIQIRSTRMHRQAEYGVASHWHYKQDQPVEMLNEGMKYSWIRHLLEILDNTESPQDFLEHTKLDLFPDQVFAFTPKGEIRALPSGATVIDFAYTIHSDIGYHCTGAKINGRMASIKTKLKNGDQVDIVTSHQQRPSSEWMNFVRTGRARASIRRANRQNDREHYIRSGCDALKHSFQEIRQEYQEKNLSPILKKFNQENIDGLLIMIGRGEISPHDVRKTLFPDVEPAQVNRSPRVSSKKEKKQVNSGFTIHGVDGNIPIKTAKCCHPVPGDQINGIISSGRGITVHTQHCRHALNRLNEHPEQQIEVFWFNHEETLFTGRIKVWLSNEKMALENLAALIGREGGVISQIKVTSRMLAFSHVLVDVKIDNASKLESIIACLQRDTHVKNVERHL